jgi:uncharacterized membrane protein YczE
VALSVKANLGVSPISCIPYVFSLKLPLTLGEVTILFNTLLVSMQIVLLRKNYRLIQLIQLPAVIMFGFFIDLSVSLFSGLTISSYGGQLACCLLSSVVIGFGVFLEVKSELTYLPGEGIAMAIVEVLQKEFGKVKICTDSSMVAIGILSSLIFFQRLQGIREGTIIAAFLVGYLAKICCRRLTILDHWLGQDSARKTTDKALAKTLLPVK